MRGVSNKHCLLTFFIGLENQLSLNAGPEYCRILHGEHSAVLSTFIKLPFVIKIFYLSIFEWPFYTGLIIQIMYLYTACMFVTDVCSDMPDTDWN